jgi:shikimate dehydrogenase
MEYGLIGEKLGHSFSKPIHEKLADYKYQLFELDKNELDEFLKNKDFKGINVTIPYKTMVIPYLDYIDESASKIGAVNTIVNRGGKLSGYNTDYYGFLYTLLHNNVNVVDKKILVIGNGGASKAVIAVLDHLKAKEIIVVGRTLRENTISFEECYEKHINCEIIINTTPVGMYPNTNATPLDLDKFRLCTDAVDLIYNPLQTTFLKDAKEHGIKGVNGLEMLIAQAKVAAEYFLDKKIDEERIQEIYEEMKNDMSK